MIRHFKIRAEKFVYCLIRPRVWRHLMRGLAPTIEHRAPFSRLQFDTVLDVGANKGQFALFAVNQWPAAQIVCFEPLPAPAKMLEREFRGLNVSLDRVALSDEVGVAEMFVTVSDDSSSLLPIGDDQKLISNTQVDHVAVAIPLDTLDNRMPLERLKGAVLLKIDVQGNELKVLKGASRTLTGVSHIYVECSYRELYRGQALITDVVEYLHGQGFALVGVFNQSTYAGLGAVQADFLFSNNAMHSARSGAQVSGLGA